MTRRSPPDNYWRGFHAAERSQGSCPEISPLSLPRPRWRESKEVGATESACRVTPPPLLGARRAIAVAVGARATLGRGRGTAWAPLAGLGPRGPRRAQGARARHVGGAGARPTAGGGGASARPPVKPRAGKDRNSGRAAC